VTHPSVLAVFAHPDDAELGCFGTLAALGANGYDVHILALTDGSASSSPAASARPDEAKQSAGVIGANLVIERLVDGALAADRETYSCVADHLDRIRPVLVITHLVGAGDHQDHETAGRAATTMAGRAPFVRMILQAEPPLMNNLFNPDVYLDITASMADKLAAIEKYQSERDKPYVAEQAIRDRATWWARQAATHDLPQVRYCEAFRLVKADLDVTSLAAACGGPRPARRGPTATAGLR
jgi:N-acetylglucosamine malate deacetylase 1